MSPRPPLPPTFSSLYRIFLRATSTSVLNHKRANKLLRTLFKPSFQAAANVIHRLNDCRTDAEREKLAAWLNLWQQRVDNTLSLLANSSQSRGLPHKLTQNLSFIYSGHYHVSTDTITPNRQYWKGQLPPDSPQYRPQEVKQRYISQKAKRDLFKKTVEESWGPLAEVMQMAEGRHGVLLGRIMKR